MRRVLKAKMKEENKTNHHIKPTSRDNDNSEKNTIYIDADKHDIYHRLFSNLLPDEIIHYLVDYFWGGQEKWLITAIKQREVYYEQKKRAQAMSYL